MWGIDWYQTEWPWPLFRGCLKYLLLSCRHWISRKPLEIERFGSKGPSTGNGLWLVKWSRERWCPVTLKGEGRDPNTLRAQYLKSGWRSRLGSTGPLTGNGLWGINGHMTDDVTCPRTVKLVTPIRSSPIFRKRLKIESAFQRTTNRKLPVPNRMVTWPTTSSDSEKSTRDPNKLRAQ